MEEIGIVSVLNTDKRDVKRYLMYFLLLYIPSLFLVQHEDLFQVVEHANDLYRIIREGKFFQFYESTYNASMMGNYVTNTGVRGGALYNIIVYLVIGLWLLPLKFMEFIGGGEFMLMGNGNVGKSIVMCAGSYVSRKS